MKKLLYAGAALLLSVGFMSSCSYKTCPAYSNSMGTKPYYSHTVAPTPSPTVATSELAR